MRSTRVITGLVAAALMVGAGVFAAPPASAATLNIALDCTDSVPIFVPEVLKVSPGDTVSITSTTTPCAGSATNLEMYAAWFSSYSGSDIFTPGSEPFVWVVSNSAPAGLTQALICVGIGFSCNYYLAFNVAGGPTENPIPPWVQAYGRSGPDATCEDGWSASWQEWAVPVTGGWVCTREVPSLG